VIAEDTDTSTEDTNTESQEISHVESDFERNTNQNLWRNMRLPIYLNDYHKDLPGIDENDDEVQNFVGFTKTDDPFNI